MPFRLKAGWYRRTPRTLSQTPLPSRSTHLRLPKRPHLRCVRRSYTPQAYKKYRAGHTGGLLQGQTLATGKTSDFKSILASQNTGSDFGASAMADAPDTPKAPLPPLPDLPVRSSNTSSSAAKPTNPPPPTSNLSQVSRPDGPAAKAWVAHTDGRTTSVESQPPLKAALPAETEQILSGQQAQRNSNQAPLAKELAQAAKAKEPVAWVAHKDGRLNQVNAEPKLADAMPVKVSERLRDSSSKASSKQHSNKGLFGKVNKGPRSKCGCVIRTHSVR